MDRSEMRLEPYLKRPKAASAASGLSEKYIRQGCIEGKIPHVKIGTDYLVNVRLLFEMLDSESRNNVRNN